MGTVGLCHGEELGVLASGSTEGQVEAAIGKCRVSEREKHVAGMTGSDLAAGVDLWRHMVKRAHSHPARGRLSVYAPDRAENRSCPTLVHRLYELTEPVRLNPLVIVDEGKEVGATLLRSLKNPVSGERNVARWAMQIHDPLPDFVSDLRYQRLRTGRLVVVSYGDPHGSVARLHLRRNRQEGAPETWPPECAHAYHYYALGHG
jgi:hypothetical protein